MQTEVSSSESMIFEMVKIKPSKYVLEYYGPDLFTYFQDVT